MPNYFSLTKVGTKEPQVLQQIDDDMRRHFGVPLDNERWYKNWYDTIGFSIAVGLPLPEIRRIWDDRVEVVDWLVTNYEWNGWSGR